MILGPSFLPSRLERDFQKGFHLSSADGALVGLCPQHLRALVAQAHVAAGQKRRVPRLRHADDALGANVVAVRRPAVVVGILQPVNFLKLVRSALRAQQQAEIRSAG